MWRVIIILSVLLIAPAGIHARNLSKSENDSVVAALATVWGKYLHDKSNKDALKGKEQNHDEYMRGLKEALGLAATPDDHYRGLQDGIAIDSRLSQIEQMGGFTIDRTKFVEMLAKAAEGKRTGFTVESADRYMNNIMAAQSSSNELIAQSEKFLEEMEHKDGVIKTPSGLLFEVIIEGEGESPRYSDNVSVLYKGSFPDGTVFDETKPDKPASFGVSDLIKGFSEGLMMMKPGGTYRLYIPPHLGYGDNGVPGTIPGGTALIFDVTLLDKKQ